MLTQRLGSQTQKNPAFINGLIQQILKNPGCCDEVWLATDYGFPPMEVHVAAAKTLKETAEKFRAAGLRVSLQLSNSIGHGEYMSSQNCDGLVYDGSPVRNMVGPDGTRAGYCFCWNDSFFREYTKRELQAYVLALHPHTVWIDDDLRASNHYPVQFGCFCDDCIARFNKTYDTDFTRFELVEKINTGSTKWRKHWIDFVREGLSDFTFDICSLIHKESPETRVGLQNCANGGYSGLGNGFLTDAIRKALGHDVPYRPGGGAYSDRNPDAFIAKADLMAYDCSMLPGDITEIRPEIESLPDIVYGKSIGGTCFETSYYFSDGCNAMSYAILMNDYESMEWHGKMLNAFSQHRAYWKRLREVNIRSHQTGLKAAFPKSAFLVKTGEPFEWSREDFGFARPLRYINIPVTFVKGDAPVYVLNEDNTRGMTRAEISDLLHKPVVTDGATVAFLFEMGELSIGAKRIDASRLRERFTAHKVNGDSVGRIWGGKWGTREDYELIGDIDRMEPLSLYESRTSDTLSEGPIASAVITTKYGAKWAVFGFDAWNDGVSTAVRNRYLNACEYISKTRFAAELLTPIRMLVSARVDENGRTVTASFTNATVGDSGELEIVLRHPAGNKFILMGQYIPETMLTAEQIGNDEYRLILPNVKAWSVATVFVD